MGIGDVIVNRTRVIYKRGVFFDGVDDYVEVPHNANQLGANLGDGFTISAWLNAKSEGELAGNILDKSTDGGRTNGFGFFNENNQIFFVINNGSLRGSGGASQVFGIWQHVMITISSGQLANFYIDGVLRGGANQNLTQTIATITTTNAPRIGNRSTGTDRTFDGTIKDVKMWNRVLSTSERIDDFAGNNITDGQILNFPLQDDYNDISQTGLTGTNSGTYFATVDDAVATVIKDARVTANDKHLLIPATKQNMSFVDVTVEEAP